MKIFNRISSHPRGAKTTLKKKAIIIGSTGATGNKLLKNLLKSDNWDKVTCISRNRVFKKNAHEKLSEVIIDSFDEGYDYKLKEGDIILKVDKRYFRPTETESLLGDGCIKIITSALALFETS